MKYIESYIFLNNRIFVVIIIYGLVFIFKDEIIFNTVSFKLTNKNIISVGKNCVLCSPGIHVFFCSFY